MRACYPAFHQRAVGLLDLSDFEVDDEGIGLHELV